MINPIKIKLEIYELRIAATAGIERRLAYLRDGDIRVNSKCHQYIWDNNIEGAIAEMAVAKYLNIYFSGSVDVGRVPDLPPDIQVRHSQYRTGHLIINHKLDNLDHRYILVTGQAPVYEIWGWMPSRFECPMSWVRQDGCIWIPGKDLLSFPMYITRG